MAPNGQDVKSFKSALEQGVSGIKHHQQLEEIGMACQVGGISDFNDTILKTYMHPNTFKALNSMPIQFMCTAVLSVWMDAGLEIDVDKVDLATKYC